MHEFTVTESIVNTAIREAQKHDAKRVKSVFLVIGRLTHLSKDQIRFSYEVLTKGTILEDSHLAIRIKNPRVSCTKCGYKGPMGKIDNQITSEWIFSLSCPRCGEQVEIVGGRECLIKGIRIEV